MNPDVSMSGSYSQEVCRGFPVTHQRHKQNDSKNSCFPALLSKFTNIRQKKLLGLNLTVLVYLQDRQKIFFYTKHNLFFLFGKIRVIKLEHMLMGKVFS